MPGVRECKHPRDAAPVHQVLCRGGDVGPGVAVEVYGIVEDGLENGLLRGSMEGRQAAQEDVDDDTAGPEIRLGAIVFLQAEILLFG